MCKEEPKRHKGPHRTWEEIQPRAANELVEAAAHLKPERERERKIKRQQRHTKNRKKKKTPGRHCGN